MIMQITLCSCCCLVTQSPSFFEKKSCVTRQKLADTLENFMIKEFSLVEQILLMYIDSLKFHLMYFLLYQSLFLPLECCNSLVLRRFVFRTEASAKRKRHASDWWRSAKDHGKRNYRLPLRANFLRERHVWVQVRARCCNIFVRAHWL